MEAETWHDMPYRGVEMSKSVLDAARHKFQVGLHSFGGVIKAFSLTSPGASAFSSAFEHLPPTTGLSLHLARPITARRLPPTKTNLLFFFFFFFRSSHILFACLRASPSRRMSPPNLAALVLSPSRRPLASS